MTQHFAIGEHLNIVQACGPNTYYLDKLTSVIFFINALNTENWNAAADDRYLCFYKILISFYIIGYIMKIFNVIDLHYNIQI